MSDLVIINGGQLVTTTPVIAAGTGVQHKNVIELVRTYANDLAEFGGVAFETEPLTTDGGTQTREIALLNEDQATLLITYMRNSQIVRRFKIALVRNFGEMRRRLADAPAAPALPNFMDPAAAARAWADQVEAKDRETARATQLEHQVAEQVPAVAGFDRLANASGTLCITDAAKNLQVRPSALTELLLQKGWMYHRPSKRGYLAYQDKIQAGYLTHKMNEYEDPKSGEQKVNEQVRITQRGLTKLALLLSAPAAPPSPDPRQLN